MSCKVVSAESRGVRGSSLGVGGRWVLLMVSVMQIDSA